LSPREAIATFIANSLYLQSAAEGIGVVLQSDNSLHNSSVSINYNNTAFEQAGEPGKLVMDEVLS
jgi:hypothetical protein